MAEPCDQTLVLWGRSRFEFARKGSTYQVLDLDFAALSIGRIHLQNERWRSAEMNFEEAYAESYFARRNHPNYLQAYRDNLVRDFFYQLRQKDAFEFRQSAQSAFFNHDLSKIFFRTKTAYWVFEVPNARILDRIWLRFPPGTDLDLGRRHAFLYIMDRHMAHFYDRDPRTIVSSRQAR